MDFSAALHACKGGARITRAGWNGPGQWVALSPGFTLTADRVFSPPVREAIGEGHGVFGPYLMIRTVQGVFIPWLVSQGDLLADDWEIA